MTSAPHVAAAGSEPDTGMGTAGPRLREIRTQHGLSLSAVAAAAGVTKGFLSQAERGLTRVSVPTLLQVCGVLGVSIGALFDYPEAAVASPVPVDMGGLGIQEYLLTPASERLIQVMRSTLEPGGGSGGSFALDCDTIFVTVLRGRFELIIEGEVRQLAVGESTTFGGRSRHEWSNPDTAATAEVLWVLAPPLAGTSPLPRAVSVQQPVAVAAATARSLPHPSPPPVKPLDIGEPA